MQVDGYSLDAQRDKLRKYAAYEDMVVAGEYSDEGFSGKNIQGRQEFQRMLNDIQDCKDGVSYVLVFKLSRFGRNAADVLNSLQLMQDFGVPCDYYDLIGFYGYGVPIPLKQDRINTALSYIARLPQGQKDVMEIVIDVYRTTDWTDMRLIKIFSLPAFASKGYTVKTALKPFGGKDGYEKVIDEMEETLL